MCDPKPGLPFLITWGFNNPRPILPIPYGPRTPWTPCGSRGVPFVSPTAPKHALFCDASRFGSVYCCLATALTSAATSLVSFQQYSTWPSQVSLTIRRRSGDIPLRPSGLLLIYSMEAHQRVTLTCWTNLQQDVGTENT